MSCVSWSRGRGFRRLVEGPPPPVWIAPGEEGTRREEPGDPGRTARLQYARRTPARTSSPRLCEIRGRVWRGPSRTRRRVHTASSPSTGPGTRSTRGSPMSPSPGTPDAAELSSSSLQRRRDEARKRRARDYDASARGLPSALYRSPFPLDSPFISDSFSSHGGSCSSFPAGSDRDRGLL